MLSTVPADQGECAVCSPPQAVAQVMIQSFQLSSCALFNAQMQDVSVHPPRPPTHLSSTLFLSASGPYLDTRDVSNVTGPFVMVLVISLFILLLCLECNACEHGRCCVVVMCFCSGRPPLLSVSSHCCCRCRVLFSPPPVRKRLTSRLCRWDL